MTDKDLSPVQIQILDTYYTDNARKLHRVVDRILSKFGGLNYKDMDDFYSLANEVFADVIRKYDDSQTRLCRRLPKGTGKSVKRTD